MRIPLWGIAAAASLACLPKADAASLRVAPVMIDLTAPSSAASVTVRNEGAQPLGVQVRVFRWTQTNGVERLEPTRDVVASPPMMNLKPGVDNVVRVVRVSKQNVVGEEGYRLIIDELPDARQRRPGMINLLVRHAIPMFFTAQSTEPARVTWSVGQSNGRMTLTASNSGGSRIRLAELALKGPRGETLVQQSGLVGYVLGGSVARWNFPSKKSLSFPVEVTVQGENGLIHAQASAASGR